MTIHDVWRSDDQIAPVPLLAAIDWSRTSPRLREIGLRNDAHRPPLRHHLYEARYGHEVRCCCAVHSALCRATSDACEKALLTRSSPHPRFATSNAAPSLQHVVRELKAGRDNLLFWTECRAYLLTNGVVQMSAPQQLVEFVLEQRAHIDPACGFMPPPPPRVQRP